MSIGTRITWVRLLGLVLALSQMARYGHCMASKEAVQHPAHQTETDLINTELEAKGISMNALSDRTGIPYATLRRSLKGARALNLIELRTIAGAIGVQPSQLLPAEFTRAKVAA